MQPLEGGRPGYIRQMHRQTITTGEAARLLGIGSTDTIRSWVETGALDGGWTEKHERRRWWVYLDSVEAHPHYQPGAAPRSQSADVQSVRDAAALLLTASRHLSEAIESQRKAFDAQADAVTLLLGPNTVEEMASR